MDKTTAIIIKMSAIFGTISTNIYFFVTAWCNLFRNKNKWHVDGYIKITL